MKNPRPQDYDPTYQRNIKVEEFDVSELTPITPTPPPSQAKTRTLANLRIRNVGGNRKTAKKMITQSRQATAKAKKSPTPNVRAVRSVRVSNNGPQKKSAASPLPAAAVEKREIKRHAFEFYRDQLPKLKQLKAEFMIKGTDKSMSAMVREAVDEYIKSHIS